MAQRFQGTTIGLSVDGVAYTLLGEITGYNFEDGERSDIDSTHSTSERKQYMSGLAEADNASFDLNLVRGGAGLALAKASKASDTPYFWQLTFSDGSKDEFQATVKSIPHSGSVDDKLSSTISIRVDSTVTEIPAP